MADAYSGVATAGAFVALPQALLDVYSMDILHKAQGIMRYEDFAVRKTELERGPGQTIKVTTYNDITIGGALAEQTAMEKKSMSASQLDITVTEYGNAIGVSEKLVQLSADDVLAEAATLLSRDYAKVRDLAIRDVVVAGGTTTLFTTSGAGAINAQDGADTLDIDTLRDGVEALQTANAPKFYDDFYVCFVHPHQAAYLRRDPDWINAQNYNQTRRLFTGELGRWEDVIFISTTHQGNGVVGATDPGYEAALAGTGLGGDDLYRATLIADQAFAIADALPVEMRDNGVEDFGRKRGLAWYGIWGQAELLADYIVHIISG